EHYNQATLFYNSLSDVEKKHFVSAVQFELGKCDEAEVQQRIIDKYNIIDHDLAVQIGSAFGGLTVPDEVRKNHGQKSEFLSQVTGTNQVFTAKGRQVGIYILPGFNSAVVTELKTAFTAAGIIPMIVGPVKGSVTSGGVTFQTQFTFETCRSTHFDGLIFVGPQDENNTEYTETLRKQGRIKHAAIEGFFHQKPLLAHGKCIPWMADLALPGEFSPSVKTGEEIQTEKGVIFVPSAGFGVEMIKQWTDLLAKHRVWDREVEHIAA
ncbi:catalase-related immune-responsive-domain-containing protein, partial [Filobasidium floriforme]|uniref:catalase-related immune-responsive-domain-containing protein n=1 Tax=Filobasidium floriforme TaxID=5210 RepID=UPI001E8E0E6B